MRQRLVLAGLLVGLALWLGEPGGLRMVQRIWLACAGCCLLLFFALNLVQPLPATAAANAGYIDFAVFERVAGGAPRTILTPTGEKPQSKLWFNDGRWWADMFSPDAGAYHIYALDRASQRWADTGIALDNRPHTKADCLWDGTHLYVVSGGGAISTGFDLDARLYRYSYVAGSYRLDAGFPVAVRSGGAETIVLAKDSTGVLWVTYTQNNAVYVNHSAGSDASWGTPYIVPGAGVNPQVAADDVSTLVAYGGAIGVLWSNQITGAFYFAYHVDGAADNRWSGGVAAQQTNLADDHMSVKAIQSDAAGNVFAAIKTSLNTPDQPQIAVLVGRRQSGARLSWRRVTVSNGALAQTRPLLMLDTTNRQLYVFTADESGGAIYYKQSSFDNLVFDPNVKGTPFISSGAYPFLNNPTSTKQNVGPASGIAVLASSDNESHPSAAPATSDVYAHNLLPLAGGLSSRPVYLPLMRR